MNNLEPTFRTLPRVSVSRDRDCRFLAALRNRRAAHHAIACSSSRRRNIATDQRRPEPAAGRAAAVAQLQLVHASDANLSSEHSLVGVAGFFPTTSRYANLGTFTPADATVDLDGGMNTAALTERALWSDAVFSETTVEVNSYGRRHPARRIADGAPAGDTLGNFFNRQMRTTTTYQVVETLSGSARPREHAASLQGRHRRSAQPLRRHRARASPCLVRRSPMARWCGGSTTVLPTIQAIRQHRRRAVRPGPRAADQSLVRRIRRAGSIATA